MKTNQAQLTWRIIFQQYLAELQRRKQVKLFIWYERLGLLLFGLWIYDSLIGFKAIAWQEAINWLGWVLTAIAMIDLAWFFYMARRRTVGS